MKNTVIIAALAALTLGACTTDPHLGLEPDPRFNKFSYVGPRTQAEVCNYFEDTRDAIYAARKAVPQIDKLWYKPKSGVIVVTTKWPARISYLEGNTVSRIFAQHRLYVTGTVHMRGNPRGDEVYPTILEYGGRDRVRELSGIPSVCDPIEGVTLPE